jgi:hypothetical protein
VRIAWVCGTRETRSQIALDEIETEVRRAISSIVLNEGNI